MHEITKLLQDFSEGDTEAFDRLMPLVEPELKKIARGYMAREIDGHILRTTALVNEALIKLIREKIGYNSRKQFYALVARRMREVLIDDAKKRKAAKRGKPVQPIDAAEAQDKAYERSLELLKLDEALTEFTKTHKRKAEIVEYHFFGGLKFNEISKTLGISQPTVERDWRFARAWLKKHMTGQE